MTEWPLFFVEGGLSLIFSFVSYSGSVIWPTNALPALSDEYFVKRKLYPNVDFYSGLIYRAMGFPPEFFTVLFAIPRMAGYLAHWRESLDDPDTKIIRPQQVYTGEWLRHYIPPKERLVPAKADRLGQVSVSNASKRRLSGSGI